MRGAAPRSSDSAAAPGPERERALTRFTLFDLFRDPTARRHALIASLMSLATTTGIWGITTWVPPFIGSVARQAGLSETQWAGFGGMAYNSGSSSATS